MGRSEPARGGARAVKPGPPSDEYLLRKLLYCERCGSRMHGTRGSQPAVRRYICSTRRYSNACGEPIVKAEPPETQIVDWLRTFQPDNSLQDLVLDAIRATTRSGSKDIHARRRELTCQLQRLQDLYVMGDLTKPQYVMRRQALEDELERTGSPADPHLDEAAALLADFDRFWEIEPSAAERRKLLASLFERVWAHKGAITAVKPRGAFVSYFHTANKHGAESESDGTRTRDLRRGSSAPKRRVPLACCCGRHRRDSHSGVTLRDPRDWPHIGPRRSPETPKPSA